MKSRDEFFIHHWQIVDMAYRAHTKGATLDEILNNLYDLGEGTFLVEGAIQYLTEVGLLQPRTDEASSTEDD